MWRDATGGADLLHLRASTVSVPCSSAESTLRPILGLVLVVVVWCRFQCVELLLLMSREPGFNVRVHSQRQRRLSQRRNLPYGPWGSKYPDLAS